MRHYWEGGHHHIIILLSLTLSARTCSGHMLQDDGVNMHTSTYIHTCTLSINMYVYM